MGVKMTLHDTERTFTIRRIKYSGKAARLCNCTETLAVSQSVKVSKVDLVTTHELAVKFAIKKYRTLLNACESLDNVS